MKPAVTFVVRSKPRSRGILLFVVAAGGIALALLSRMGMEPAPQPPPAAARALIKPLRTLAAVVPQRDSEISTDALQGEGITVADWMKKIARSTSGRVLFSSSDLASSFPSLTIYEYDGDASLPPGDALDILRYAGFEISAKGPNEFETRWADSGSQIAADVSNSTDPDSLGWAALRSWQRVAFKVDAGWRSALADAKTQPTLTQVRELAWAVQGEVHRVEMGADGHVVATHTNVPSAAELDAALNVFASSIENPELAFDAARGLAAFENADSASRMERATSVLLGGLKSVNLETQRISAWALGRSSSVSALEALVSAVDNAGSPAQFVSSALVALTYFEKSNRHLDASSQGTENWARRQAAWQRLRNWLASPHHDASDSEYAKATLEARKSFQADFLQAAVSVDSIAVAGPSWLHVPFEGEDALRMLRSAEQRNILAALWRWNRMGADLPTALSFADVEAALSESMQAILKSSTSITQRRLALEALYRSSDKRLGTEPRALCDDPALALNAFLNDPSVAVQRSASVLVGKLSGIVQLQMLAQADLAVRQRAGTDQLLKTLVQCYWLDHPATADTSFVINGLIDQFLTAGDSRVAECAAWAKMQDPNLDVGEKLRAAKTLPRPELRAIALKSLNISRIHVEVPSKWVEVFLRDDAAIVREAFFDSQIPLLVDRGVVRKTFYTRGFQDPEASVRLAVLKSRMTLASDMREALIEQVKALAENDVSQDVRAAASAWLLLPDPAR